MYSIIIGIIVGIISVVFLKFNVGWAMFVFPTLIFAIISIILVEKYKLNPNMITMAVTYWIVLLIGGFIIVSLRTSSSIWQFFGSLWISSIQSLFVFMVSAFLVFLAAKIFNLKEVRKRIFAKGK